MKEKKDGKNIRYIGFEATSDGGRRFDFSITAVGQPSTHVTLAIPGVAFTGENRISYQESAKICFEKLQTLIESDAPIAERLHIDVSGDDIARFRKVPRGQAKPKN